MTVKDYMSSNLVTLTPDMEVLVAIKLLIENRVNAAPVADKRGNLIGMLSEKDCLGVVLKAAYLEELGGKVSEFMSSSVKTVNMDDSLVDVAMMFLKDPYKRYPVMRDNLLVGQITRRDVLKALEKIW
jgi:predicted transcriptional regulator